MKLASALLSFLYATLAASSTLTFWGKDQNTLAAEDTVKVPGKNPLTYCANPKNYILDIDFVDLDPNPPKPGSKLKINASGTFAKDVEAGAKVFIQVKYNLITLIRQEADLCDQIGNVDLSCPLKKGPMNITKDVDLPSQVPKGKYTVLADVSTNDSQTITCLESVVFF